MKWLRVHIYLANSFLHYSTTSSALFSFLMFVLGVLLLPFKKTKAASRLMLSHRNAYSVKKQIRRERVMRRFGLFDAGVIDSLVPPPDPDTPEDIFRRRIIKVKEPLGKEKGVLVVSFLDSFSRICRQYDIKRILNDYFLVLELSYYGCCSPEILQYLKFAPEVITVGAVQDYEVAFLKRLNSNLVVADFSSSAWVDHRRYYPMERDKEFDCIFVGTWDRIKRHYILLKALKRLNDPTYKALLVGVPWGGTRQEIENLIDHYGVRRNVTIMEKLQIPEVNEMLNRSKVKILCTLKEGGNKAIIESMMTNTPIIVMKEHIGIKRAWINDQTGKMVGHNELPATLDWFRTNYRTFSPRKWALENISCLQSTVKLEQTLKQVSERLNLPWTKSLIVKVNHGWEPVPFNSEDALTPFDFDHYRKPAGRTGVN